MNRFEGYAQRFDFIGLFTGNSFKFTFNVTDKRVEPCIPFDFTYYGGGVMKLFKAGHSKTFLEFNTSDSSIVLSSGSIELYKESIDLVGNYIYTLDFENEEGDTFSWLYGKFELLPVKGVYDYLERLQSDNTNIDIVLPNIQNININIV